MLCSLLTVMKPYYEHAGITIYHGDCQQLLSDLSSIEDFVDVLITDPPYGTAKYASDIWGYDYLTDLIPRFSCAAVFGYPENLVRWCVEGKLLPFEWVTWFPTNKACGRALGYLPRSSEHIAIFGKTVGSSMLVRPRSDETWTKKICENRGVDLLTARLEDVWIEASPGMAFNSHLRRHPNEKPEVIMTNLVTLCSRSDDVIVDPFAGSGTTLWAAKQLGRRAIGIEIEEKYCEIAAKRLSQEVLEFNNG